MSFQHLSDFSHLQNICPSLNGRFSHESEAPICGSTEALIDEAESLPTLPSTLTVWLWLIEVQ